MTEAAFHIPTLETERLTLRAPRGSDFPAFAEFSAAGRSVFVGGPAEPANAWQKFCALAGQWLLRGYGRWLVADRESDAPLGVVGLHHPLEWPEPEIAWLLFDGAEGRGMAREAAVAARDFAYRTLGWTTAISFIDPENVRSLALAQRLGCFADGVFDHAVFGPMHIWRHPGPEALS